MYDIPVHVAQTCLTTHQAGTRVWYNGFTHGEVFTPSRPQIGRAHPVVHKGADEFSLLAARSKWGPILPLSPRQLLRSPWWISTCSSAPQSHQKSMASSSSEHSGFHGIFATMMTSLNPKIPRKDDQDWEKPPWMHECSIILLFQNFQKHGLFRVFLDFRVVFPTLTWFPSFLFCLFTYVYGELSRLDQALGGSASDSRGGWSRWTWESRLQETHQVAGTANDANVIKKIVIPVIPQDATLKNLPSGNLT